MGPKLVILMLVAMLASCNAPPPPSSVDQAGDQILKQLAEVNKEIKALKGELAQLRQAVTEIHRAEVPTPAAAAPAPPVTIEVNLDPDDPILGNREAKLGVVEFSDYQCPFCQRFHTQTFPKLKETYIDTGKIRYIFRDFPLDFHGQAKGTAIAANCAGKQDRYWDMHHALFADQKRLGPALYEGLAGTLGLDVTAFLACTQDDEQGREVSGDSAYAQSLGVSGTPTFFVGRLEGGRLVQAKRITGAQSFQAFAQVIDSLLQSTVGGEPGSANAITVNQ
ncbi:MAG: DsbA family protein [Gammaproteobacteria bacterium]